MSCSNPDCLYFHEFGSQDDSFTKDETISYYTRYTTSPHLFSGDAEKAFDRVRSKVKVPLYGCDCYAYALLASGFVNLAVESGLKVRLHFPFFASDISRRLRHILLFVGYTASCSLWLC